MQKCSKCKYEKPLDCFGKGNKINGTDSWCKGCKSKQSKLHRSNPDVKMRSNAREKERRLRNPERAILNNIRNRASRFDIPFNLTLEDCVIPSHCPVLGIPLKFCSDKVNGIISDNSPSVDKIEPSKGYVKGNTRVISWRANHIKNNATLVELEAICKYVRESTVGP